MRFCAKKCGLLLAVLLAMGLGGCSWDSLRDTAEWVFTDQSTFSPAPVSNTAAAETPVLEPSPVPTAGAADENTGISQQQAAIMANSLETAEGYKSLYLAAGNLTLSQTDMQAIADALGEQGLCAITIEQASAMTNPHLATAFLQQADAEEASLTIFEICQDGGFLRHDLFCAATGDQVVQTRLIWSGETPEISFCETYDLTALREEGGCLVYEYFIPNNPEGGNHDGHIDPIASFRLY